MTMGFIGRSVRRHRLRKWASTEATGVTPLSSIRRATVIIDASDPAFEECRDEVMRFFGERGIKTRILYSDFRRFNKEVRPVTDEKDTFMRKDIGIFGLPKMKKLRPLIEEECDLLISLPDDERFLTEFFTKAVKARFKIGSCGCGGEQFDLVVTPEWTGRCRDGRQSAEESAQKEVFDKISELLLQMR